MGHCTNFELIFAIFLSSFYVWKCTETQTLARCKRYYWMQNMSEKNRVLFVSGIFGCFLGTISSLLSGALSFLGCSCSKIFSDKKLPSWELFGPFSSLFRVFPFIPPKDQKFFSGNFCCFSPQKIHWQGRGDGQVVIKTVFYSLFINILIMKRRLFQTWSPQVYMVRR